MDYTIINKNSIKIIEILKEGRTYFNEIHEKTGIKSKNNLLKNLNDLPIWTDRDRTHLFSKKEYGYWQEILRTGKSPDNIQVLNEGVNIVEMIKR